VIEPKYSFVDHFNEYGYAKVWTGSTWENTGFPDLTGSKMGLIDSLGNEVIALGKYDWLSYGLNGNIIVRNEDKCGIISVSEKVLLPFGQYISIEAVLNKYYIVAKEQNGKKYGVLDENGSILIPIKYEGIAAFTYADKTAFGVQLNDKGGVLDENGSILIPIKYESITVLTYADKTAFLVRLNGKYGLVNENDNIIAPFKYDLMGNGFSSQMSKINRFPVSSNKKAGWIDINGQEVIPCIYEDNFATHTSRGYFYFGLTVIAKKSNNNNGYKYGIIDTKGQIILPIIYEYANICSNNSISVLLNGKSFSVDRNGIKIKDLENYFDCN
jgi:hypothetical protein